MTPPGSGKIKKWGIFAVAAVGVFMSTLDGSIVNIALPTIMKELSVPLSTVEWVMMIYLLTVSSLLLAFGRLSDIQGRRWIYTRGLAVFSAGSLLCGMSVNAASLIASRAIQGVGAAMVMSCTQAIVAEAFPAAERGKALGLIGAVVASGLTIGPAAGGWILHLLSWQAIFWVNVPVGLLTGLAAARLLEGGDSAETLQKESFDWIAALLMTVFMSALLTGLAHGYDWGYDSAAVAGLTGVTGLSLIALVRKTKHARFPLIHPDLLRTRMFIMPVLSAMVLFMALFTIIFLMPFFLIHPCGFSVQQTGYVMVTPFVALFAVSPVAGALSDRLGSRWLCTLGMAILMGSFHLLAAVSPGMSAADIAARLAVSGLGIAIFTPPNNVEVLSSVPPRHMGVAAGAVATMRNLGMVLGIALAGALFNSVFTRLTGGVRFSGFRPEWEPMFMEAFRDAMLAGMVISGIGLVITFLRGPDAS